MNVHIKRSNLRTSPGVGQVENIQKVGMDLRISQAQKKYSIPIKKCVFFKTDAYFCRKTICISGSIPDFRAAHPRQSWLEYPTGTFIMNPIVE